MNANTSQSDATGDRHVQEALRRAEQVPLSDFGAALSSGLLTALEARRLRPGAGNWKPWIWAGLWIGDGPLQGGPFGGEGMQGKDLPGSGGGF